VLPKQFSQNHKETIEAGCSRKRILLNHPKYRLQLGQFQSSPYNRGEESQSKNLVIYYSNCCVMERLQTPFYCKHMLKPDQPNSAEAILSDLEAGSREGSAHDKRNIFS